MSEEMQKNWLSLLSSVGLFMAIWILSESVIMLLNH